MELSKLKLLVSQKCNNTNNRIVANVELVSSIFDTIRVSIMRNSHFFYTNTVWVLTAFLFSIPFGFIYHDRAFIPRQNRPSINMVYNGVDPNNNSA
jgi:hypothetical protein